MKLPFSRRPEVRKLKRKAAQVEKENQLLKKKLKRQDSSGKDVPDTPRKEAAEVLRASNITPSKERIEALAPYTDVMDRVAKSDASLKKKTLQQRKT